MKSVIQDSRLKIQDSFLYFVLRFAFHFFPVFSCLLLAFLVSDVAAEIPTLRVLDADGVEFASLEILQIDSTEYVSEKEVSTLFSGIRRFDGLVGRVNITIMGKRVVFTLGRHQVKVDNEEYVLSRPVTSISGIVAIPVEFLTEILPAIIEKQTKLDRENWVLQISREAFMREGKQAVDIPIPPEPDASEFRVIVDPGHGGSEEGARSRTGLLEKEQALKIAERIKELLAVEEGVDVYLTRSSDRYMTATERVNFANKLRGHIYLSIHFNWSPSQRSRGFSIYSNSSRMRLGTGFDLGADMFSRTKEGKLSEVERFLPQSERLAREIADRLESIGLTGEQNKEVFLASMDDLSMPCVLVEVLYLSNSQDLLILSRPDFINSVARALCDSILAFRSTSKGKNIPRL